MRYWDASAIVPLVVSEAGSDLARGWLRDDPRIATWSLTLAEVTGAVERRARDDQLSREERREALARFSRLANAWDEIVDLLPVRVLALRLLARHPLRTADALQLGAALVLADGQIESTPFVCLDRNLAAAAEREGFPVLTWPDA